MPACIACHGILPLPPNLNTLPVPLGVVVVAGDGVNNKYMEPINPRPAGPLDFPPPAGGRLNAPPPHDLGSWSP